LGPEITFDYHERISLFGVRDGFLIAGTLAASSSPTLVEWLFNLSDTIEGERAKFFWIAIIYAPLVIGFSWWCVISIKELPYRGVKRPGGIEKGLRQIARNRPFVILLIAYTISAIGNNLPATLILFYVEYVLQSNLADVFLLIYFVTGIIFLPGWISISRKIGKKTAWLASMAINTGAFFGVFFLGPGDEVIYGVLVFLSGIGFGATLAIPSAIQADVIDYDEWLTGERREGQYIGLWSISKKLAAAIGVGAGLSILGTAGYMPNVEQSEQVKLVLRTLYALVPCICNLIAILIALIYPISSKVHQNIRNAIDDRKKGIFVIDPMKPVSSTP
jgi:GPH family glycoside/pentoside/hexuronide:cation symporter